MKSGVRPPTQGLGRPSLGRACHLVLNLHDSVSRPPVLARLRACRRPRPRRWPRRGGRRPSRSGDPHEVRSQTDIPWQQRINGTIVRPTSCLPVGSALAIGPVASSHRRQPGEGSMSCSPGFSLPGLRVAVERVDHPAGSIEPHLNALDRRGAATVPGSGRRPNALAAEGSYAAVRARSEMARDPRSPPAPRSDRGSRAGQRRRSASRRSRSEAR